MKRLITEKARSDAFLPTASIKNTALRHPNRAPIQRRLLIQVACSMLMVMVALLLSREGREGEEKAMHIP